MDAALQVSRSRDHFQKDGKPWFYLADTAWSAFTNCRPDEWEYYLDYRASQGFNAVQINILPQWDRSAEDFSPQPFALRGNGTWDFSRMQDAYFEKAVSMVSAARQRGLVPALVVLWCDFVKDTWACRRMPDHEMPLEAVQPYAAFVAREFGKHDPIFIISGDTDFPSTEAIARYNAALTAVKEGCPRALTTFHLQPRADLPPEISGAAQLDFYMFQSGHSLPQDTPYRLAERFAAKQIKRPAVNGEPCYEGHGHGNSYGRFSAFEVRRAIWQSLLSGAKAGVTYGAHGVWSWHRPGLPFGSAAFSSFPYSWETALQFRGAWDAGYAKQVFETYGLFDIQAQGAPVSGREDIRLASSPDNAKVVVYAPYATELELP
ncbi:MAG TPA: DUF4038 domain-containing protein, partial [Spirochaetia bacterium]|nr:DUF4038 domain-containing protein [Spirochaetia bacterium]